ncbi:hypothetical protein SARC_00453 [Sphaeroforma arctica JP610]|uniref:Uncharacterized protein n=1 Tax=Sphaeroforma arctica JP610 TaxID=667725 RepID=A0A0L0GEX1_9EUKA|nr:hypothetical protein SARC_00453 [Sphaeroforma arctica JP610]KNC87416.1 hypothetical protein SARC_00453 [Sphaeroforma arctica JP610]|eukprot:XP_014161318.1 hypothetical protein SARC_00453 [Sphaeroforma arctica JP610]
MYSRPTGGVGEGGEDVHHQYPLEHNSSIEHSSSLHQTAPLHQPAPIHQAAPMHQTAPLHQTAHMHQTAPMRQEAPDHPSEPLDDAETGHNGTHKEWMSDTREVSVPAQNEGQYPNYDHGELMKFNVPVGRSSDDGNASGDSYSQAGCTEFNSSMPENISAQTPIAHMSPNVGVFDAQLSHSMTSPGAARTDANNTTPQSNPTRRYPTEHKIWFAELNHGPESVTDENMASYLKLRWDTLKTLSGFKTAKAFIYNLLLANGKLAYTKKHFHMYPLYTEAIKTITESHDYRHASKPIPRKKGSTDAAPNALLANINEPGGVMAAMDEQLHCNSPNDTGIYTDQQTGQTQYKRPRDDRESMTDQGDSTGGDVRDGEESVIIQYPEVHAHAHKVARLTQAPDVHDRAHAARESFDIAVNGGVDTIDCQLESHDGQATVHEMQEMVSDNQVDPSQPSPVEQMQNTEQMQSAETRPVEEQKSTEPAVSQGMVLMDGSMHNVTAEQQQGPVVKYRGGKGKANVGAVPVGSKRYGTEHKIWFEDLKLTLDDANDENIAMYINKRWAMLKSRSGIKTAKAFVFNVMIEAGKPPYHRVNCHLYPKYKLALDTIEAAPEYKNGYKKESGNVPNPAPSYEYAYAEVGPADVQVQEYAQIAYPNSELNNSGQPQLDGSEQTNMNATAQSHTDEGSGQTQDGTPAHPPLSSSTHPPLSNPSPPHMSSSAHPQSVPAGNAVSQDTAVNENQQNLALAAPPPHEPSTATGPHSPTTTVMNTIVSSPPQAQLHHVQPQTTDQNQNPVAPVATAVASNEPNVNADWSRRYMTECKIWFEELKWGADSITDEKIAYFIQERFNTLNGTQLEPAKAFVYNILVENGKPPYIEANFGLYPVYTRALAKIAQFAEKQSAVVPVQPMYGVGVPPHMHPHTIPVEPAANTEYMQYAQYYPPSSAATLPLTHGMHVNNTQAISLTAQGSTTSGFEAKNDSSVGGAKGEGSAIEKGGRKKKARMPPLKGARKYRTEYKLWHEEMKWTAADLDDEHMAKYINIRWETLKTASGIKTSKAFLHNMLMENSKLPYHKGYYHLYPLYRTAIEKITKALETQPVSFTPEDVMVMLRNLYELYNGNSDAQALRLAVLIVLCVKLELKVEDLPHLRSNHVVPKINSMTKRLELHVSLPDQILQSRIKDGSGQQSLLIAACSCVGELIQNMDCPAHILENYWKRIPENNSERMFLRSVNDKAKRFITIPMGKKVLFAAAGVCNSMLAKPYPSNSVNNHSFRSIT